ncbi:hypothetical protein AB0B89_35230 [Sphaerisporangium sp. NPDC049002]|uniref:hypothetical protein n=1 Tax=unclassified Sphaerisporangium TaxID=2630420 RepID=UPI00340739CD
MSRRVLFKVGAALCAAAAIVLVVVVVGLDTADKLASVLGLVVALAGLAASLRGAARSRRQEGEATVDRLDGTEATSLVNAMAGDNWRQARAVLLGLWRDALPDRLPDVEAALEETRRELSAVSADAVPDLRSEFVTEWQSRLRRHALAAPGFVPALHRVIAHQIAPLAAPAVPPGIQMNATSYDHSRINQSAGNMYINDQSDQSPRRKLGDEAG